MFNFMYICVDVIYPNLKYMNNVLIIVDEFHGPQSGPSGRITRP